jgi:hypothetical protein
MHDGRATTIHDRFGVAATSRHGLTASLSAAQLDDLVAFLEQL